MESEHEPTKRRKVVKPYEYDGKEESEMLELFKKHCDNPDYKTIDRNDYKGVTLETAREDPIEVPDVGSTITLPTRVGTGSVEFIKNFSYGINRIECTELVQETFRHLRLSILDPDCPMFLRGPGGVGKSTALVAAAMKSLERGYISVFVQLKQFTGVGRNLVQLWARNCLRDFAEDSKFGSKEKNPWRFIGMSDPQVSCYGFLKMMQATNLDTAHSLFAMSLLFGCLSVEAEIPVVICLDQWNSMEKDYWSMDGFCTMYTKETHPIAQLFLNWEFVREPVIFQALSSSCGADVSSGSDGNGTISHYHAKVWTPALAVNFISFIKETKSITDDPGDMNEIAELCGFLPREIIRYYKVARYDRDKYVDDATKHYKKRVAGLMSRDSVESLKFSAYVYMHKADWNNMPESWLVSGVMHEGGRTWVCKAAREGFFHAFRETNNNYFSGALAALKIFADEETSRGTALELAMIHHFNLRRKFQPESLCTDLQGKAVTNNVSFQCSNIEFISKAERGSMDPLVNNTVYILWAGAAVVDFFVYESDTHFAWLQISKSKYNAHRTKAEHIFKPANNYPVDTATNDHHSPYSYFKARMSQTYRGIRKFQSNEYYFYLTPNMANPSRKLKQVEKNNCLLIHSDNFRDFLDDRISTSIKAIFEDVE